MPRTLLLNYDLRLFSNEPTLPLTSNESARGKGDKFFEGHSDSFHQHLSFERGLKIASLNVNGLRSHHDEIHLLLRNHDIHIIAINETKLDPNYSTQLTRINGFEHERKDRTSNGGGVAVYIKDSISYKLRTDIPYVIAI